MDQNPKLIPTDGVSKKLKIVIIILTALTLLAFVALLSKLASNQFIFPKNSAAVRESAPNSNLIDEYQKVGTRLMNSGLKKQAIDQFIKIWETEKIDATQRAEAAQTVGRLYADLDDCPQALVWLFRAEVLGSNKMLTSRINACLKKIRGGIPDQ